jgi:hypothetical protein
MVSKFEKDHLSRFPHSLYSPDISPWDFWPFGMLKEIMKDCEYNLNDEIEEAIASAWKDLTFEDAQSVLRNWASHHARS